MPAKRKKSNMKGMTIGSGNKRPTKQGAGLSAKGVAKYRKQNPGSKLQTAVTEKKPTGKRAARRKSYCARSAGQMKKFPKAAKNPNSRLRQARKRWKCQLTTIFEHAINHDLVRPDYKEYRCTKTPCACTIPKMCKGKWRKYQKDLMQHIYLKFKDTYNNGD